MHSLYYVLIDKESAKTSEEARSLAHSTLHEEDFVMMKGGFFASGGRCDWFVIGGRWTGILEQHGMVRGRDPYREFGYEDDAKIFTKELHQYLQDSNFDADFYISGELEEGSITDYLPEEMYDNYWIVVIDYHS